MRFHFLNPLIIFLFAPWFSSPKAESRRTSGSFLLFKCLKFDYGFAPFAFNRYRVTAFSFCYHLLSWMIGFKRNFSCSFSQFLIAVWASDFVHNNLIKIKKAQPWKGYLPELGLQTKISGYGPVIITLFCYLHFVFSFASAAFDKNLFPFYSK